MREPIVASVEFARELSQTPSTLGRCRARRVLLFAVGTPVMMHLRSNAARVRIDPTMKGTLIGRDRTHTISLGRSQALPAGDFDFASLGGKPGVLNFWASWCGPCRAEMPQLELVHQRYQPRGVSFVGIDTKDQREAPIDFLRNAGVTYTNVSDEAGKIVLQLHGVPSTALPFTVLIDKRSRIAAVYLGMVTPKDLEPVLDSLLAEPS